MQRFVIIAPTRSGSTMLVRSLMEHSNICCENERNTQFRKHLHSLEDFCGWIEEFYTKSIKLKIQRKEIPKHVGKKQLKARGFKLLYEHYERVTSSGLPLADLLQQHQVKVIWLTRRSLYLQYLSHAFAALTNKWSHEPYPPERFRKGASVCERNGVKHTEDGRLILPIENTKKTSGITLVSKISYWVEREQSILAQLKQAGLPILMTTYEDLIHQWTQECKRLCDHLELPLEVPTHVSVKQSPDDWDCYVANLSSIREWLEQNGFADRI